ncbi:hypothetical protein THAOC_19033 [Thalassiosira oceanica]|uniref:Uncharacterized protein n=1 Tax=Thalassiosira oceanica TaxID=159749 RepID=K0S3C0_THAOC|nr:hypothetical protein THAOC_19033 [Thalassiosira oceanica]|eukprot:EJK60583.1 hypothetical protein THAOC_19033 [Thalassiosira oceanica]
MGRELLDGTMDFALLPEYFGCSFDRDYAEKLITGSVESDDPETTQLSGLTRQLILWQVFATGSFMDFDLLPEYFRGSSFDREYVEKLVGLVEAFGEDMGLKVGSGVAAENHEEEEDRPGPGWGKPGETGTKDDEGKSEKAEDKEDEQFVLTGGLSSWLHNSWVG